MPQVLDETSSVFAAAMMNLRVARIEACVRTLAAELAEVRQEQAAFAGTSTLERVTSRRIDLAERWGEPTLAGVHISVPLTQAQLASWARSSLESTAKALHALRAAGLIETGRRELVVLDLDGLRSRDHHLFVRDVTIDRVRAIIRGHG